MVFDKTFKLLIPHVVQLLLFIASVGCQWFPPMQFQPEMNVLCLMMTALVDSHQCSAHAFRSKNGILCFLPKFLINSFHVVLRQVVFDSGNVLFLQISWNTNDCSYFMIVDFELANFSCCSKLAFFFQFNVKLWLLSVATFSIYALIPWRDVR